VAAAASALHRAEWFEQWWRHIDATYSHNQIAGLGSFILHNVVYTLFTLFSIGLSQFRCFDRYKIQPRKPISWTEIFECLRLVWLTRVLVEFPLYCIALPAYLQYQGLPFGYDEIPPWTTYVWKMYLCLALEDLYHYFCHRLLHHPFIYGKVHKIHHTYTAPFGIVAEYAHPIETLVLGIGFFVPLIVMCDHCIFMFVWFLVRQVQTHEAHIGYSFPHNPLHMLPFYGGAVAHDLHHKTFTCNYSSTFTYWDRLFGTYVDPSPTMPPHLQWHDKTASSPAAPASPTSSKKST